MVNLVSLVLMLLNQRHFNPFSVMKVELEGWGSHIQISQVSLILLCKTLISLISSLTGVKCSVIEFCILFCLLLGLQAGLSLKWQQYKAMFMKRFLNSKRDKKAIITQLILPLVMVLFGLLLITTIPARDNDPPRVLKLSNLSVDGVHTKAFFADFRNLSSAAKEETLKVIILTALLSVFKNWWNALELFARCKTKPCVMCAWVLFKLLSYSLNFCGTKRAKIDPQERNILDAVAIKHLGLQHSDYSGCIFSMQLLFLEL